MATYNVLKSFAKEDGTMVYANRFGATVELDDKEAKRPLEIKAIEKPKQDK